MYELRIFLEKNRNVYRVFKVFPEQTLEQLEDLIEVAFSLSPCLKSNFSVEIRNGKMAEMTTIVERQTREASNHLVEDFFIKRADRLLYVRDEQFSAYIQLQHITQERLQHVICLAGQGTLLSPRTDIDLTELNQMIKDKSGNALLKEQLVDHFEHNVVRFETKEIKMKKQLLRVANDLRQLEPWRFFEDYRIFAIQTQQNHKYFVSMTGHSGDDLDLVIYRLSGYEELKDLLAKNRANPSNAYTVHFVELQQLAHEDMEFLKRGRFENEGGVRFRNYQIGVLPTLLDVNDIDILLPILRGAYQLISMRKNGQWLNAITGQHLTVATIDAAGAILNIEKIQVHAFSKNDIVIPMNDIELYEIKRMPVSKLKVEFDMFYLPTPIPTLELEREELPLSYIVVNCETGQILKREVITFPKDTQTIQRVFWEVISGLQEKPSIVYVDTHIYLHIAELAYRCGIDLQIAELERVEEYKSFMLQTTEWY